MRLKVHQKFGVITFVLGIFAFVSHYLVIRFWALTRGVPVEQFIDEYHWLMTRLFFADILIFLFATVLFLTSIQDISAPLKRLTEVIRQTRQKNYNADFPSGGVEEIGELNEEIRKMVEDVRNQQKMRSDFITSISHQLPTPIARIRLELAALEKILKGKKKNEEILEILRKIERDNRLSVKLSNDILELIEIGEGYRALIKEKILLKAMFNAIFGALKEEIGKKRLNFTVNIPDDFTIYGEEYRLKSAFYNIVENAVWYSNKGGSITVGVKKEKDSVVVVIENTGIGINDKDKMHVFDRFYRAQNAYIEQTVGTGLGLTIAKIIVLGHDGSVWFDSAENEGVLFYVSLPEQASLNY